MNTDIPDTRYLFRMTDSTGLLQHAVSGIPDPTHGYTTDDNARALIVAALLYRETPEPRTEQLLVRYMSFLLYAEQEGWFRNFMDYNRTFLEERGSEDSFGRCICALSFVIRQQNIPKAIRESALILMERVLPSCSLVQYPHGIAYVLAGLSDLSNSELTEEKTKLADSLVTGYQRASTDSWHWFEDTITYCSGIFPTALLRAGTTEHTEAWITIGLESLEFLSEAVFRKDMFKPIGCKGWYQKGSKPVEFDEQPVEACSILIACREAYKLTGQRIWKERQNLCYEWYTGKNIQEHPMIDPETGGCFDGITRGSFNCNQGAESIVCWLLSALIMKTEGR